MNLLEGDHKFDIFRLCGVLVNHVMRKIEKVIYMGEVGIMGKANIASVVSSPTNNQLHYSLFG